MTEIQRPGGDGIPAFDSKEYQSSDFDMSAFMDAGLLWALNHYVLGPRGFMVSWDVTAKVFNLWGTGSEPLTFSDDMVAKYSAKLEATLGALTKSYAENHERAIDVAKLLEELEGE